MAAKIANNPSEISVGPNKASAEDDKPFEKLVGIGFCFQLPEVLPAAQSASKSAVSDENTVRLGL